MERQAAETEAAEMERTSAAADPFREFHSSSLSRLLNPIARLWTDEAQAEQQAVDWEPPPFREPG